MTVIYFTRHGQTTWNLEKRLQGKGNSELTDEGIKQAEALRYRLDNQDIDVIYSSPLKRAKETANIIKGNRNIDVILEEGLQEINFGEYEGHTEEELLREGKGKEISPILKGDMQLRAPGGESLEEVYKRVYKALDTILQREKDKRILIVAHGITSKAIVSYFKEEDEFFKEILGQGSLSKVVEVNSKYVFEYINDTEHINDKVKCGW